MPSIPSGMPVSELPIETVGPIGLRRATSAFLVDDFPTDPDIPIICFGRLRKSASRASEER